MVKPALKPVSVAEYLETEPNSSVRREYVGGQVYAMAGASQRHSRICGNVFALCWQMARGKNCRVHQEGMRLFIGQSEQSDTEKAIYYPDVMVVCGKPVANDYYETEPCILVEVLSPTTSAIDLREKKLEYTRLPSLQTYLMVDQDSLLVRHAWRDAEGRWQEQDLAGDGVIALPCLGGQITLPQIYQDVFA
ncbi:MAG: Uma2 family endonuclease [Meiothermus sp.]|nr:Uma2 family endonuclease [Meiothermus sp.]